MRRALAAILLVFIVLLGACRKEGQRAAPGDPSAFVLIPKYRPCEAFKFSPGQVSAEVGRESTAVFWGPGGIGTDTAVVVTFTAEAVETPSSYQVRRGATQGQAVSVVITPDPGADTSFRSPVFVRVYYRPCVETCAPWAAETAFAMEVAPNTSFVGGIDRRDLEYVEFVAYHLTEYALAFP